jgi:hypothetical protein
MNMKTCSVCKLDKPFEEFSKNARKKDGYNYDCKECHREYAKTHYKGNKEAYQAAATIARDASVERKREFLYKYYQENPCVDCGTADVRVLQSDHQGDKKYEISRLVSSGYSLNTLKAELAKCVTRCANCHQIRTAEQFGLWRHNYVVV